MTRLLFIPALASAFVLSIAFIAEIDVALNLGRVLP